MGSTSTSSTNARRTPRQGRCVITHGWPGSIVEFHKVIEPLTDPTAHRRRGGRRLPCDLPDAAGIRLLRQAGPDRLGGRADRRRRGPTLMARLGYDRYFAQGGDWGSAVTRAIGAQDADHCAAIHITLAMGTRPDGSTAIRRPRNSGRSTAPSTTGHGTPGYSKQQATRPQTVGYGLADSPAGQAAWILEKFWAWTDCDGHPENVLTRDEMLDNVMLYWATNSATSSARIYWESFGKARAIQRRSSGRRCGVSEGDRYSGALVDGGRLSQHRPLVRAAKRRPLRRVRATRAVRRRHPNVLPPVPLTTALATPPIRHRAAPASTEPARISPRSRRAA